ARDTHTRGICFSGRRDAGSNWNARSIIFQLSCPHACRNAHVTASEPHRSHVRRTSHSRRNGNGSVRRCGGLVFPPPPVLRTVPYRDKRAQYRRHIAIRTNYYVHDCLGSVITTHLATAVTSIRYCNAV